LGTIDRVLCLQTLIHNFGVFNLLCIEVHYLIPDLIEDFIYGFIRYVFDYCR